MMSVKANLSSIFSSLFIILIFCTVGVSQKSNSYKEIVVKFKAEHSPKQFKCANSNLSCHPGLSKLDLKPRKTENVSDFIASDVRVLRFNSDEDLEKVISTYKQSGLFEYVESNFIAEPFAGGDKQITPNDSQYDLQWSLRNTGHLDFAMCKMDSDIDADKAWVIEKGSSAIKVAIIDSGVDYLHPDLVNRVWKNTDEIANNGIDDDNNGLVDDYHGYDFAEGVSDPMDTNGHGTHVAGIIGAQANNGIGITGIDWNAKIMPIKVIRNDKTASYSDYAAAVYYAVSQGANVINFSLTSYTYSQTVEDAFEYAYNQGVVIVVAMANNGNQTMHYMAQSQYSIAVGATTPLDTRAGFSNYNNYIDVVAPGAFIFSLNLSSNDHNIALAHGTSQAAPLVAGLASLLLAQNPNRTPADIKWIITETAEDQIGSKTEDFPGYDIYFGHGRINAYNALNYKSGSGPIATSTAQSFGDDQSTTNSAEAVETNCSEIHTDEFNQGTGIWTLGGNDANLVGLSPTLSEAIRLQDNSGIKSSMYTKPTDYREYEALEVSFVLFMTGVGFGESLILEVSNDFGASFDQVAKWTCGYALPANMITTKTATIESIFLSENTIIRLRADASSNRDKFYIDDLSISGCKQYFDNTLSSNVEENISTELLETSESPLEISFLKIYPNPASDYIMIDRSLIAYNTFSVTIHSVDGSVVHNSQFSVDEEVMIDITMLSAQQYFVSVRSAEAVSTPLIKSFVKS